MPSKCRRVRVGELICDYLLFLWRSPLLRSRSTATHCSTLRSTATCGYVRRHACILLPHVSLKTNARTRVWTPSLRVESDPWESFPTTCRPQHKKRFPMPMPENKKPKEAVLLPCSAARVRPPPEFRVLRTVWLSARRSGRICGACARFNNSYLPASPAFNPHFQSPSRSPSRSLPFGLTQPTTAVHLTPSCRLPSAVSVRPALRHSKMLATVFREAIGLPTSHRRKQLGRGGATSNKSATTTTTTTTTRRTANYELRTTNYELRTTNYELRTTNDGRRTKNEERRTTNEERRTTTTTKISFVRSFVRSFVHSNERTNERTKASTHSLNQP